MLRSLKQKHEETVNDNRNRDDAGSAGDGPGVHGRRVDEREPKRQRRRGFWRDGAADGSGIRPMEVHAHGRGHRPACRLGWRLSAG